MKSQVWLFWQVLKRGAHVNDRDGLTDMTLLHYASKAGAHGLGEADEACQVVRMLHARGADVFIRCRWTNMAALHYATYFDVGSVVSELLQDSEAMGNCVWMGGWVGGRASGCSGPSLTLG